MPLPTYSAASAASWKCIHPSATGAMTRPWPREWCETLSADSIGQPGSALKQGARRLLERFMVTGHNVIAISFPATAARILPAMQPSFDHHDLPAVTAPSGWVQRGERCELWWNGRPWLLHRPHAVSGFRVRLDARGASQPARPRRQRAAGATPSAGARLGFAAVAGDAVARLVDVAPGAGAARSLRLRAAAPAGAARRGRGREVARIKQALAPRRPAAMARPDVQARGQNGWSPGTAPAAPARAMPIVPRARSSPLR